MEQKMRIRIMAVILAFSPAIAFAQTPGTQLVDFQAEGRIRLLEADADKDGKLSNEEWTARSGGASGQNTAAGFRQLDANNDDMLDQAELDALLERRFKRMDANGDGQLTADERQAAT